MSNGSVMPNGSAALNGSAAPKGTAEAQRRASDGGAVHYPGAASDLGPAKERFIRGFAVVTLLYGAYFIGWRWTATLNLDALWISVPLVLAETTVLLTTFLLVFNVWRLRRREPPLAPAGRKVDVFITTYDEPLEMIRKTALAARAIHYPHRTYLLDDGRRFEVRSLARELGIGYITRDDNTHAKAGNLNNALRATRSEFVLQLDADHVPLPHILDRLLGYLNDPCVAFVQSPQNFYNTDSFGSHLDRESRRFLTDQNIFFSVIQPGKDAHNAAFFCGSGGVLRRAALDEIGGFSTQTITEDIETSLLLHARGWHSVYHNEPLAYGLAPRTATAFHIQRLRWAQGGMQLLRRFNPLSYPGLGWRQRLCYVSSVLHPLDGLVRLIFLLTPLIFLFTGAFPIRTLDGEYITRFIPFILTFLLLHRLLSRGTGGPLWFVEYGSMARFFTHTIALLAYLSRKRLGFRVTPKGLNGVSWASYAPHLVLMVVTLVAVTWAGIAFRSDLMVDGPRGQSDLPFLVNFVWAGWNFAMAALVLHASIRSHQRRPDHRFEDLLPTRFFIEGDDEPEERIGLTENLNARGLAFRSVRPVPVGTRLQCVLPLTTDHVTVSGRVVHNRQASTGNVSFHHHGVVFDTLPRAITDSIELHCTQHAVPLAKTRYVERSDPFLNAGRLLRDKRHERRHVVLLAAEICILSEPHARAAGASCLAVLEETSRSGARFLLDQPIAAGADIAFRIPDSDIEGTLAVTYCTTVTTPFGARCIIGAKKRVGRLPHHLDNRNEGRMRKVAMLAGLVAAAKRFAIASLLLGAAATGPARAHAQLTHGYLTGAERDSDGQMLVLLGGWLGKPVPGWTPVAGAIGYRLSYGDDAQSTVVWAVNPFLGARHQWLRGGLQASAGYSFQRIDGDNDIDHVGRQRVSSGLTMSLQGDYGSTESFATQAIVNYAWDDEGYLWSRVRGSHHVAGQHAAQLRLGAEATYQGNGSYHAYEAGPLLEWRAAPGIALVAVGGWRHGVVPDVSSRNVGYARLELVVVR